MPSIKIEFPESSWIYPAPLKLFGKVGKLQSSTYSTITAKSFAPPMFEDSRRMSSPNLISSLPDSSFFKSWSGDIKRRYLPFISVAGPREFKYFPIVDLATYWGISSFSRE